MIISPYYPKYIIPKKTTKDTNEKTRKHLFKRNSHRFSWTPNLDMLASNADSTNNFRPGTGF